MAAKNHSSHNVTFVTLLEKYIGLEKGARLELIPCADLYVK